MQTIAFVKKSLQADCYTLVLNRLSKFRLGSNELLYFILRRIQMIRKSSFILIVAAIVLSLKAVNFAQKTTGELQRTPKDPKGADVPGLNVNLHGGTVGYTLTVQIHEDGGY